MTGYALRVRFTERLGAFRDARLAGDVWAAEGTILSSVTVSRSLDTGDREPQRIPATELGVVLVPAIEQLKGLLRR